MVVKLGEIMKLGNVPESYWAALDTFETRATVSITRKASMVEERVWLNTHCRGRFTVGVTIDRKGERVCNGAFRICTTFRYDIQFEDRQDAMLFKLTYGGLE